MFENAGTPLVNEGIDDGGLLGFDDGEALGGTTGGGGLADGPVPVEALGTQAAATANVTAIVDAYRTEP